MRARIGLRSAALVYLVLILVAPVAMVFYRTFQHGLEPVWAAISNPDAVHALWLTVLITLIAVPANTVFGVLMAMILVRRRWRGKTLVSALIDLPLALSPVVVGLSLILVWGRTGWWGEWLGAHGFQIIFAVPGMVLATIFVSLPFVVREVVPVLRAAGTEQEQAAATLGASPLQIFWRITLPAIRWGVVYGVVLTTARCLGEFGAVSVVSGNVVGRTETLTLHVQNEFQHFDLVGAYAASVVLALMAIATVTAMTLIGPKEGVH